MLGQPCEFQVIGSLKQCHHVNIMPAPRGHACRYTIRYRRVVTASTAAGACRALTPLRCKHLTVRLQHASRAVIINFIFAARTARCERRPWYPQRAERAADCGAVPAARRIIFLNVFFRPCAKAATFRNVCISDCYRLFMRPALLVVACD